MPFAGGKQVVFKCKPTNGLFFSGPCLHIVLIAYLSGRIEIYMVMVC